MDTAYCRAYGRRFDLRLSSAEAAALTADDLDLLRDFGASECLLTEIQQRAHESPAGGWVVSMARQTVITFEEWRARSAPVTGRRRALTHDRAAGSGRGVRAVPG